MMTAEEIVMGGYTAFGSGDMETLGKIYHPECKTTFHANHALGEEYSGCCQTNENSHQIAGAA